MDTVRKLTHIQHHLLFEGIEFDLEGTPNVPVLMAHLAQGTVIGVDLETVCLLVQYRESDEPLEVLSMRHGGNIELLVNAVKTFRLADLAPDAKHMIALARGIITPVWSNPV